MYPSRNCGLPYYLGGEIEDRAVWRVATPELSPGEFSIDVRTRQEVMAIDRTAKTLTVQEAHNRARLSEPYDSSSILAPWRQPNGAARCPARRPQQRYVAQSEDTDRIASACPTHAAQLWWAVVSSASKSLSSSVTWSGSRARGRITAPGAATPRPRNG